MLKGLLPKEFAFFEYFEKASEINIKVSELFLEFCQNGKNIEEYNEKIKALEKEGDKISHTCTEALHQTFITPFERTDIFDLITKQDDITDHINSAMSRMVLYEVKELKEEAKKFAVILNNCAIELSKAIKGLRNIKNFEAIKQNLIIVHDLEGEGDNILKQALLNLFRSGDAIELIKWKEIFERLEKAVDRCENLANVIEGVILDNA